MVARRRVVEDPVSHERWLISYADFITLLFAFFVVMYSISQVNVGKFKVLSDTLSEVFNNVEQGSVEEGNSDRLSVAMGEPERSIDPFQVGELAKSNPRSIIELLAAGIKEEDGKTNIAVDEDVDDTIKTHELSAEFEQISKQLDGAFGDLIASELLTVRGNEEWLEVELNSALLFESGGSVLSVPALELLGSISEILKQQGNPVRVEGFTDSQAINSARYSSNWALSTARASSVVELFVEEGLDPSRFAVVGYGEFQPIADNSTEQGRLANRRVVLMISKTGELRPSLRRVTNAEELAEEQLMSGIRINVPGVNSPDPEDASDQSLEGVETIELEGGGTLFTNEPGI